MMCVCVHTCTCAYVGISFVFQTNGMQDSTVTPPAKKDVQTVTDPLLSMGGSSLTHH